jgi:hypothetical protein
MSSLAEKVIFIAGHKVTNDPVAIPFSMVSERHKNDDGGGGGDNDRTVYMDGYVLLLNK